MLSEVQVMHCTVCDNDLILMNVVRDTIPSLEHHSFICSECHITQHRVVFTRHGREDDIEPVPIHAAPPTVPSTVQEELIEAPSLFSRVVARIRGH